MDGKHFENGDWEQRWRHDNHVISLTEFPSNTNPKLMTSDWCRFTCVVWTENLWSVFGVKIPFSNYSSVVWTARGHSSCQPSKLTPFIYNITPYATVPDCGLLTFQIIIVSWSHHEWTKIPFNYFWLLLRCILRFLWGPLNFKECFWWRLFRWWDA